MDCNMPVMNGYETTRRIRQKEAIAKLPIIALTANALADERDRCRAAGMDDYLAKPFRKEELAALLDQWLGSVN
jgi:CheY-like chemotaxis protein